MSKTTPIRDENAIDEIAFVILFDKELDGNILAKLEDMRDELSADLPDFNVLSAIQVPVDPQNISSPVSKPSGILFSKKSEVDENRFEWSLRAERNRVVVACSEYTKWKEIKEKALVLLSTASEKCSLETNPIVEIVYQCVDKFIFEGELEEYQVGEVFNIDAAFLTQNVVENNRYAWHVHQGWFSEHEDMVALNNLNLNSHMQDDPQLHETEIIHFARIRKADGTDINDRDILVGDGGQIGYLEKAMETSHELNKEVLRNLLSENMLTVIGI